MAIGPDDAPPERHPDGVALDLRSAPLTPTLSARARGIVALRPPPSRDEVLAIVHAYFRALGDGGGEGLASLLTQDAQRLDVPGQGKLADSLGQRVRTLDYTHASVETFPAYDAVRITRYDVASADVRRADALVPGDLVVDVPMSTTDAANVRLFGPRVLFVLRWSAGSWRIAALDEDGPWV